jgi:uncharacterized caspase-like protein
MREITGNLYAKCHQGAMSSIFGFQSASPFRAGNLGACLAGLGLVVGGLAQAEVRALVIGIDEYQHGTSLKGAVADAQDIATALRALGVKDLRVRLNAEATREILVQDWRDLVARAQPGDTLVLTYAGHGSQQPERVPGSEADGMDEILLLGGFAEQGEGTRERIVDDEFNQWFKEATDKGLEILFLADACHSGTLTRGVDSRASGGRVRYSAYGAITDDMLELDLPPTAATLGEDDLPGLTFLAAGQENQKVPEIPLFDAQGRRAPRGALSWAFSRALEGQADQDSDGRLTRDEINRFVRANVRAVAEARQTPNLLPMADEQRVVLPLAGIRGPTAATPKALPEARVRILASDEAAATALGRELTGMMLVARDKEADLVFDTRARQAISGQGDVLARDLRRPALQTVIDKWRGLERLKWERLGDRLTMRVLPNDGTHRRGERIGFEIDDIQLPYLVFFSLSGDGTLHYHYPWPEDPERVPIGRPVKVEFDVTPPFGADHLVAVASDQSLGELAALLKSLDGKPAPGPAVEAVLAAIRQGRRQLGIQGLFTAP